MKITGVSKEHAVSIFSGKWRFCPEDIDILLCLKYIQGCVIRQWL
jgi:hypothetical protein